MGALARVALALVLLLVVLSAYLRLSDSGVGCEGWPGCYARIGPPPATLAAVPPDQVYAQLVEQGRERLAWATPLHRLVASVLGMLVLALLLAAWRLGRHRRATLAAFALVVFLATLGLWSGGLHSPAVVMGNLFGGFCLLGAIGWIAWRETPGAGAAADPRLARAALLATVLLAGQVALGGLTSANFAATACPTVPDCNGVWLPDASLGVALDLSRQHALDAEGRATGGPERVAVQVAHRWSALLTALAVALAATLAYRRGPPALALALLGLIGAELGVGVAAVLTPLPIELAVAHNALAGLLLLALLGLLARAVPR